MTAITFDTLQFAKRLRALGMTDSQAEIFAEAQKEAITSYCGNCLGYQV